MIIDEILRLMPTAETYADDDKYLNVMARERYLSEDQLDLLFNVESVKASIREVMPTNLTERKEIVTDILKSLVEKYALVVSLGNECWIKETDEFEANEEIKTIRFAQRSSLEMYISNYVDYGIEIDCIDEKLIRNSFGMCVVESEFIDRICSEIKHLNKRPFPEQLDNNEIKNILTKAINAGFIVFDNDSYRWSEKHNKQLLAYFCQEMSNRFKLSSKLDKDGAVTVNWKIFESLFDVKNLKSSKNDWMKYNTKFTPNGYEEIDALF